MHIAKRITALCLSLLLLMMTTAQAEEPFLVHSNGWNWDGTPVEVLLKVDVDTHMPFNDDRLAMLTPITDMLSLRLVAGEDEGSVTIAFADQEVLTLQYRGNEAQLSCLPDTTYIAQEDPLAALLGSEASVGSIYEMLGLAPEGETLLTDGAALLAAFPAAFEEFGKRTKSEINITGYGQSAYRYDYTIPSNEAEGMGETLLSICPDGWLHEIIGGLAFSGKQTLRVYYDEQDVLLRAEYNGSCGPADDLRTVNLVYKTCHDEGLEKDLLELTSPAKKGQNKNTLNFERVVQTGADGQRTVKGSFDYTTKADDVTSILKGEFDLCNAVTDAADVVTGAVTFQYKLDGAEKYTALTLTPDLVISGTEEAPTISGTLTVKEEYASKVTELAVLSIDLKPAQPLTWTERAQNLDLSAMDENDLAAIRQEFSAAVTTAIVRPLILMLGQEGDWFFRELDAETVQSIIDAAGAAQ